MILGGAVGVLALVGVGLFLAFRPHPPSPTPPIPTPSSNGSTTAVIPPDHAHIEPNVPVAPVVDLATALAQSLRARLNADPNAAAPGVLLPLLADANGADAAKWLGEKTQLKAPLRFTSDPDKHTATAIGEK